jgi:hypothetical protein
VDEKGGASNTHGKDVNAYKIFNGKSEQKKPLRRPKRRWEDNIKMNLRKTEWEVVKWIHLAQDRDNFLALVNKVMNLQVPDKARIFLTS